MIAVSDAAVAGVAFVVVVLMQQLQRFESGFSSQPCLFAVEDQLVSVPLERHSSYLDHVHALFVPECHVQLYDLVLLSPLDY